MILADTSIWIDHLRSPNAHLSARLHAISIGIHPWVIGELACGNLSKRAAFLRQLQSLPQLMPAAEDEVLSFIEHNKISGRGIGYIDMHLLAAAKLNGTRLWTRDKRLNQTASELKIAYLPPAGFGMPS